jgi:hypothetical protein
MATLRSSYEAAVVSEPKTALDFAQQVGEYQNIYRLEVAIAIAAAGTFKNIRLLSV